MDVVAFDVIIEVWHLDVLAVLSFETIEIGPIDIISETYDDVSENSTILRKAGVLLRWESFMSFFEIFDFIII